MKNETPAVLEKNRIVRSVIESTPAASGCCGGASESNADACCKLDEEKKAEGEAGCGCNTSAKSTSKSACC